MKLSNGAGIFLPHQVAICTAQRRFEKFLANAADDGNVFNA